MVMISSVERQSYTGVERRAGRLISEGFMRKERVALKSEMLTERDVALALLSPDLHNDVELVTALENNLLLLGIDVQTKVVNPKLFLSGIKKENLLQLLQLKIRNVDATAYHEANLWMEKIETNRKAGESTHSFARGFVDTNNLSLHEAVSFPNDWGFFDEYNSVDTFVAKRLLARVCNSEGIFIKI